MTSEESGVAEAFDALVTAEDVKRGKPDPETFLLAAQKMGVDPSRCVGMEDADLGIEALVRAGMRAVDVRQHCEYPRSEASRASLLAATK
jgi:HAD superfamily hydrolase (TIGR01509 family)